VSVVFSVGSGLWDNLITRSEESYCVCVCVCVCMCVCVCVCVCVCACVCNGATLARVGLLRDKRMFLAWRRFLRPPFKFLHKHYLLMNNIKIIIAFVGSTPAVLSGRLLIFKSSRKFILSVCLGFYLLVLFHCLLEYYLELVI
jgi:hypothetical protein